MEDVVIVSAARTPIGSFNGSLATTPAPELGATALKGAMSRAGVDPESIDQTIMGCVLPAGQGQAPARQASLAAGIPQSVPTSTVNKVCGSGLQAVILGAQQIKLGDAKIIAAGGMENMSLAPHLLEKSRAGYKMGNVNLTDHMVKDGLWDVYNDIHMGSCAESCVTDRSITREQMDAFTVESYTRAQAAVNDGTFAAETQAVSIPQRKGDPILFEKDEEPFRTNFDKIPKLPAVFERDGGITAANASTINDGGAALILMSKSEADRRGLKPLARIVSYGLGAREPKWFTTAPEIAVNQALERASWKAADVDLWEINEAFAVVPMALMKTLELSHERVNVNGGSVALGHPIGASGARILTTLLHSMDRRGAMRGLATLCIGGGEANALAVERL